MKNLRNLLPSANCLFAFEAAARHQSFTLAADELNVSQPAISHAVKLLEDSLGKKLFHRNHRRIELTQHGKQFYQDVSSGLEHIFFSAQDLQLNKTKEMVTISGSTLFIQFWMLPRLNAFNAAFPNLNLRLHSTDRDVSLHTEGIDISIRLGDGKWPEYDVALFAEELV
ncbi:MAG: LysR family transcriptional regulator, partial [Alphaproteobacteria bacterium]|nr:LysR family transcriptional regulator [Alphaproteobacteria bacterium]